MKTEQAKAASEIKKYLKAKGLKCSVLSHSGSMTTSVRATVYDLPPALFKEIDKYCDQYQEGDFDGMSDSYEYRRTKDNLPKVKYVFVTNEYSDELKQKAWLYVRETCSGGEECPENYSELSYCHQVFNEQATTIIYRCLNGALDSISERFWLSLAPAKAPEPPKIEPSLTADACLNCEQLRVPGARIEEHTHTKKGFQMFIVVLPEKVEREEYLKLLDKAKTLGGWYSMAWKGISGGFAFKDRAKAEEFISWLSGTPGPEPKKEPVNCEELQDSSSCEPLQVSEVDQKLSVKLKESADKMQSYIDFKLSSNRLMNTNKRYKQAMQARTEGLQLERTQKAMYILSDMWANGTVPEILKQFKTKQLIYEAMSSKKTMVQNGYHSFYSCDGKPYKDTPEVLALWALLIPKTEEQKKAEELQAKIESLQFSNIPGYFPTSDLVIDKMIEYADIQPEDIILEPELGSYSIADKVKPLCKRIDGYEINYTLAEICKAKGFLIDQKDFLAVEPRQVYDKVLMNPPFEKWQDIAHIKHAMKFLKPDGKLIAICANGPRQEKELKTLCDIWEYLPVGSFKHAGTGVNTAMIVITV